MAAVIIGYLGGGADPWIHIVSVMDKALGSLSGSPQRNMEPDYKLFSLHPGLSCLCAVVHLLFTWNDLPSACPRRPHFQRPIPILPFL